MNDNATHVPPHDIDAEVAVLSCVLLDPRTLAVVSRSLTPQDMFSEAHRRILEAAMAIHESGSPVDLVTVGSYLKNNDRIAQVGGMSYLTEILNYAPALANAAEYARTVKRHAVARSLIAHYQQAAARLYLRAEVGDIATETRNTTTSLVSAMGYCERPRLERLDTVEKQAMKHAAIRMKYGVQLPTGLADLDRHTEGLHRGELTIVAARPAMGKTAFAACVALNVAKFGTVLFFSLEMPKTQIAQRMMCVLEGMSMGQVRRGDDMIKLQNAINRSASIPVELDDVTRDPVQILDLCHERKEALERNGGRLAAVFVDQLGKCKHPSAARDDLAIGKTTTLFAEGAQFLDVPFVVLHQIGRSGEKNENRRPSMKDLKNSGCVEEDASTILLLYRDEQYDPDSESKGIAEVIIAKQRNGESGMVKVAYDGRTTTFRNLLRVA